MICRAEVDQYSCSGHGDCVLAAPTVFRLDDEIAEVIAEGPEELLVAAAEACPAAAISVFEADTGERIYP